MNGGFLSRDPQVVAKERTRFDRQFGRDAQPAGFDRHAFGRITIVAGFDDPDFAVVQHDPLYGEISQTVANRLPNT